jgi:hypothetical protein
MRAERAKIARAFKEAEIALRRLGTVVGEKDAAHSEVDLARLATFRDNFFFKKKWVRVHLML